MSDTALQERIRKAREDLDEEMREMYRAQKQEQDDYARQLIAERTPCGCH